MTKEQFGLWKHEPVTKWFFEYLIAKREFLKSASLEQWLAGNTFTETVRGQIIELEEITSLPFEAIEAFYEEKNELESQGNP